MKSTGILVLVLGSLVTVSLLGQAPANRGPAAPASGGPTAGSTPKAATPPAPKKEEPPPKIEGMTIPRTNGTFLGLEIVSNNFVLKFFDKEKKAAKPDVSRATARWPVKYQPTDERVVLNLAEDKLTNAMIIRPPHQFKLTLVLLSDVPDKPVETYIVDYRE